MTGPHPLWVLAGTPLLPNSRTTLGLVTDPLNGATACQRRIRWGTLSWGSVIAVCGSTVAMPAHFVPIEQHFHIDQSHEPLGSLQCGRKITQHPHG
jgi:hypothetical protein